MHDRKRLLVIVLLMLFGPVFGQSLPAPPPLKIQTTTQVIPSAASIRADISRLSQTTNIDETVRAKALRDYKEALLHIEAINAWRAKSAINDAAIKAVPGKLTEGQRQLETATTSAKAEVPLGTVHEMEMLLSQINTQLNTAKKMRADLESEPTRRRARRLAIAQAIENARRQIAEIAEKLTISPANTPLESMNSRRIRLETHRVSLQVEIQALGIEMRRYDAEQELIPLLFVVETGRVSRTERLRMSLEQRINKKRKELADLAIQVAIEAAIQTAKGHPAIKKLAADNVILMTRRAESGSPVEKIPQITAQLKNTKGLLDKLERRLRRLREQEKVIGDTSTFGFMLRKQRAELPDSETSSAITKDRKMEMSRVQLEIVAFRDQRSSLSDINGRISSLVSSMHPALTGSDRENFEEAARILLEHRLKGLNRLIESYGNYFSKLVNLEIESRLLMEKTKEMAKYIDERVLWIRSTDTVNIQDLSSLPIALKSISTSPAWGESLEVCLAGLRQHLVKAYAILLALVALLTVQIWVALKSKTKTSKKTEKLFSTLGVVLPIIWGVVIPLLVFLIGRQLEMAKEVSQGTQAIGVGLLAGGRSLFTIMLILAVCWPNGLAEVHFGWSRRRTRSIRLWFLLLLAVLPITAALTAGFSWQTEQAWKISFGRLVLMVGLLVLTLCAQRLLRPSYLLPSKPISNIDSGLEWRMRHVWQFIGTGLPLVLFVLTALGYYHTAMQLAHEMVTTFLFVAGIVAFNIFANRYLGRAYVRLLGLQKRRKIKRAALLADPGIAQNQSLTDQAAIGADLPAETINRRSRQFLNAISVTILVVGLWMIWSDSVQSLGILRRFELWQYTETTSVQTASPSGGLIEQTLEQTVPVTLSDLIISLGILVLALIAARTFPAVLGMVAPRRVKLNQGNLHFFGELLRYAIAVGGIAVAMSRLGVSWASIQWLVAALTIGLGFGLQEIVANFVAGIIILFERPFRIGDTVTVAGTTGTVTRIRIRSTTITDWDRKELIVPNKDFIVGKLTNWSLSDKVLRVILEVGVAYGSNTSEAEKVLYQTAKNSSLVLKSPAPFVLLKSFGNNSLGFELRVYIRGVEQYLDAWHDLNMAIEKAFSEAGITIAFPQQDTHLSTLKPLEIKLLSRAEANG
jgi:potassium efflux system protein